MRIIKVGTLILIAGLLLACNNTENHKPNTITIVGSNKDIETKLVENYSETTQNIIHTNEELSEQLELNESQIENKVVEQVELKSEDNIKFIKTLNSLDEVAKTNGYNTIDEIKYIRTEGDSSVYWGELMGYNDSEMNKLFESYSDEIKSLREERLLTIENTDYTIQVIHMFATLNCLKEGLGSLGGWKGDICEIVESIDKNLDTDTTYTQAYLSFSEPNTKFNIYDIYSDISAVNIAKTLPLNGDLSDCVKRYFIDVQTYNPFAMFIRNEFNITTRNRDLLYESIYNSLNSDILVRYLMKTMQIEGRDLQLRAVCRAFADFIYDNITDEELVKLNELYTIQYTDNIRRVEHELSLKNKDKVKELLNKFITENGKEKIDEFLSNTTGYFSN